MAHESFLRIPLYSLYYMKKIPDQPLSQDALKEFWRGYEKEERRGIRDALRWAASQPDYPFASLLPQLGFSDQDAYRYLMNLLRQLERFFFHDDEEAKLRRERDAC